MADGNITIDTILSTDKFDRQISSLEKKMKKEEDKRIKKQVQIQGLEKQIADYDKAKQKVIEYEQELKKLQSEKISAGPEKFTQINEQIQEIGTKLAEQRKIEQSLGKNYENNIIKLTLMRKEYEDIKENAVQYKSQIEAVKLQKQASEVDRIKEGFKGVSSSLQEAIGRAGKLALSIFGIRSAYMMLRRASSDLASYDEQYAANLEYIRFVLTQAVAPVLNWIVGLAAQLLQLINAIFQALFGINIFSSGSAENFQKMKAGAGGVGKAVKEIKKQLMGFDEVNVLTSQSDTGTGGGAGGVGMPNFDLSTTGKMGEFLEKAKNMWKELGEYIDNALNDPRFWDGTFGNWGAALHGLVFMAKGAYDTIDGLFQGLAGLAQVIVGLITGDMELVKKGAKNLADGLWKIFKGLGELIMGLVEFVLGTVIGLVKSLFDFKKIRDSLIKGIDVLIKKLVKEKKGIKDVQQAQEDLTKAKESAKRAEDNYIDAVDKSEEALRKLQEAEAASGISGEELYRQVKEGVLDYKDMNNVQRDVYKAYMDNLNAEEDLKLATDELAQAKANETQASLDNSEAIAYEKDNYGKYKDAVIEAYEKGEISAEEARTRIEKAMAGMSDDTKKVFTKDLPNDIAEGLDPNRFESFWTRFRNSWNNFMRTLNTKLEIWLKANFSAGAYEGHGGGSGGGRAKGGIYYPNLLKLASGGIINMPGRGALYHGAYIGERGAEAVVPLTDSQQMELLGATIGKYITVNANIVNEMNGRVISRQLKQVQATQDFAYNT